MPISRSLRRRSGGAPPRPQLSILVQTAKWLTRTGATSAQGVAPDTSLGWRASGKGRVPCCSGSGRQTADGKIENVWARISGSDGIICLRAFSTIHGHHAFRQSVVVLPPRAILFKHVADAIHIDTLSTEARSERHRIRHSQNASRMTPNTVERCLMQHQ